MILFDLSVTMFLKKSYFHIDIHIFIRTMSIFKNYKINNIDIMVN